MIAPFGWPAGRLLEHIGVTEDPGLQLTAVSGGAAAYGSWVELGTTTIACQALRVLQYGGYYNAPGKIELGVGSAGNEETLLADWITQGGYFRDADAYWLPFALPAGTRIAARAANSSAGSYHAFGVETWAFGHKRTWGDCRITAYGVGTYSGTTVTGGNGVKGSWTELTASTTDGMRFAYLCVTPSHQENYGAWRTFAVDVGVGAASSEMVVAADLPFMAYYYAVMPQRVILPLRLPAGVRIAVRAQADGATENAIRSAVYGVR